MLLKLLNVVMLLSIIPLLYLRLGRKVIKVTPWLAIIIGIWLIELVIFMPIFHLVELTRFKNLLTISATVLSLVLLYYLGQLMTWGINRLPLSDDIKGFFNRFLSITFNHGIFLFYFLIFLVGSIYGLFK